MALIMSEAGAEWMDCWNNFFKLIRSDVYTGGGIAKGNGEPVVLIPGFLGGDWTLMVLAKWLKRIGYAPYLSGIYCNRRCPRETADNLGRRIEYLYNKAGPLSLIGHSLGGILARQLGHVFPQKIKRIITLGTPVKQEGVIKSGLARVVEAFARVWMPCMRLQGQRSITCSCGLFPAVFEAMPTGVSCCSIFSKEDRIVGWFAQMRSDERYEEVTGGHSGLIVNLQAYRVIANVLAG